MILSFSVFVGKSRAVMLRASKPTVAIYEIGSTQTSSTRAQKSARIRIILRQRLHTRVYQRLPKNPVSVAPVSA